MTGPDCADNKRRNLYGRLNFKQQTDFVFKRSQFCF